MKMTRFEKLFVNRSSHTRTVASRARQLLAYVVPEAGWRYLDVGCGVGAAAQEIVRTTDLDVTGVDVDPEQIKAARARAEAPNLRFLVMDATRLAFRDCEFDIVATSMMTHHVPNWERILVEMARVLRTGGYLIYSDFVFPSWLAKAGRRLIPFVGFPSGSALASLAASQGLIQIHSAKAAGKTEVIWLKRGVELKEHPGSPLLAKQVG